MKFEEMKEEELKETLELVKRVFDEFEAPDYTGEGVTNFYKFIAYDSILEQLKNNFKIYKHTQAHLHIMKCKQNICWRNKT